MLDNQPKLQSVVMGQMPGIPAQGKSIYPSVQQQGLEFLDTSGYSSTSSQPRNNR
jgi:hypothetical protein